MSDYGVTNCTAEERERLRIQLHSYCLEGGYCRKIPPGKLYCQCLEGWKNDICDTPDFLGAADLKMVVVIPLVVVIAIIILCVVIFFLVRRHRQHRAKEERQRREQSGNPLINRRGNQPIYRPMSGTTAPALQPQPPVWNVETGSQRKEYLA
ncbi:hypothetical protein BOX15_Mlig002914g1 [Macrostomum lignano]|uniref:EGF-like domain-containing protein n=1 Tax=Macrostomum lignano TaxID=282301 RepID=A0A267ELE9_9PLAT|nr:hypothetical protein BOX15_Mlig002914g1 [Macrostomum lignano]